MRTCSKCGATKPLNEYYKQADCRDGYRPDCKECVRNRVLADRDGRLEEHRERDRARYANDPKRNAEVKARARLHYEENRDEHRARRSTYYKLHRNEWYAYRARRKKRLADAFVENVSFDFIAQRDLGICGICGLQILDTKVELDHIIPLAAGGMHESKNVQLAHRACNRRKWTAMPD